MDHRQAKQAIDIDAARAFRRRSPLELDGLLHFLRQQIVDAEWEITRQQQSIDTYKAVIKKIEDAIETDPARIAQG